MFLEQFPEDGQQHGWIEVICGSMFSGKTEELIRRLKRGLFANQEILLIKPKADNRYHDTHVVSHQGTTIEAKTVQSAQEILKIWRKERLVAIDEAQFFDEGIISVCNQLASKGVRVIIAGLDMDFQGTPFGPMPQLMAIAEYTTKVHAICLDCGNLAQFSHRISSEKAQLQLGATESYKPLCRSCFNKLNPCN
jgi:thymidine kinase